MKNIFTLTAFIVTMIGHGTMAEAQQTKKVPRIGYLTPFDAASESASTELNKQRPDGLYVLGAGALMAANRKRIVGFALKNQLPSMSGSKEAVEAGGLASYSANDAEIFGRLAIYVDKILKGTKPADLPVEQPMRFEFVINLKTAKQIGLTIPQWTLMRADKVIQ